jgi:hypothetical protein
MEWSTVVKADGGIASTPEILTAVPILSHSQENSQRIDFEIECQNIDGSIPNYDPDFVVRRAEEEICLQCV